MPTRASVIECVYAHERRKAEVHSTRRFCRPYNLTLEIHSLTAKAIHRKKLIVIRTSRRVTFCIIAFASCLTAACWLVAKPDTNSTDVREWSQSYFVFGRVSFCAPRRDTMNAATLTHTQLVQDKHRAASK